MLSVYLVNSMMISTFQYNTKYYYRIGSGDSSREFWFETPPKVEPDATYKFGIIGKLFVTNVCCTRKYFFASLIVVSFYFYFIKYYLSGFPFALISHNFNFVVLPKE